VFNHGGETWLSFHTHLWSIPVEFKGSILIYTSLMAFSRITKNARLWCQVVLIFYFSYITDGWYCAMFVSGMLLCDLDLLAAKKQLPRVLARLEPAKNFIFYHLLVFSLYLGGIPAKNRDLSLLQEQRGWYYLSLLKPQAFFDYKWFYLLFASAFLVASVPRIRWLKSFFETRFCQYLGRISYALYLVHGPVLWTFGDRLYTAFGWHLEEQRANLHPWVDKLALPKAGPMGLEVSFLVPNLILLPLTIWVAELVTRLVDEPSVRFAQWLYARMLPHPVKQ
jgi:peptidoglycan/LPS O-acetylase OafA/YrhL